MFKGRSFLVKMVKDDDAGHQEEVDVGDQVKSHFEKYKSAYITGAVGVAFASVTCLYMKGRYSGVLRVPDSSQPISRGIAVTADRGIAVAGKRVAMSNVSFISSDRQGPPSWVIRCKETGDIFTSQRSAAFEMNIPASELSQHLNGARDHVYGNHFERICLAG